MGSAYSDPPSVCNNSVSQLDFVSIVCLLERKKYLVCLRVDKKLQYFAQLCCGGLPSNSSILSKKNVTGITVETLCNFLKGNLHGLHFWFLVNFVHQSFGERSLFVFSLPSLHTEDNHNNTINNSPSKLLTEDKY